MSIGQTLGLICSGTLGVLVLFWIAIAVSLLSWNNKDGDL